MENKNKIQNFNDISATELLPLVRNLKEEGYRFVQLCGTAKEGGTVVMYSFDKDYDMVHYNVLVKNEEAVESITETYWNAFVYENEVADLFGVKFLHNALDYHGNFFKTAETTPWKMK